MNKFSQTKLFESMWDNSFEYDLTNTRSLNGLCIMYYVIQHFKSSNLLEIGYKHGTDFMAMLEATGPGSTLTAVDIDLDLTRHEKYYKPIIGDRQVNLIETPSQSFKPLGVYDFILIDGCHDYPQTFIDLALILKHTDHNSIIMMDDYRWAGVDPAIDDFLALDTGFVPFLNDGQAIYFHHESHDANDFLDRVLAHTFYDLATLYNDEYKSYNVTTLNFWPSVWNDRDPRVFWLICKRLKI
jgi:predicted O-methyltransferase YrrM